MDNSKWPGLWVLLLGLAMTTWGLALLVKPDLLRPRTPIYRWVYWRWFARGRDRAEEQLSRQQIRYYAVGVTVAGLVIVTVVALMLVHL